MALGKTDNQNTAPSLTPVKTSGNLGAFLGNGTKVVGTLTFSGPVELDGYVEGEIHAQDKLTIGEASSIKATIRGAEILIKGTVNGDIIASKRLVLRKPAQVAGNIQAPSLTIEEGVIFEGKCSMGGAAAKSTQPTSSMTEKVAAVGGTKGATA